jgi:hypothetical protein
MKRNLYRGKNLSVYDIDGKESLELNEEVAIVPYNNNGANFLVRFEPNPLFHNKKAITLLSDYLYENEKPIEGAVRILSDSIGFEIPAYYFKSLGKIRLGKNTTSQTITLYTCDLSDVKINPDVFNLYNKWTNKAALYNLISSSDCSLFLSCISKLISYRILKMN